MIDGAERPGPSPQRAVDQPVAHTPVTVGEDCCEVTAKSLGEYLASGGGLAGRRRGFPSVRQSPPVASAPARSSRILPGSWRASGFRHGLHASASAVVSPTVWAVLS